MPFPGITAFRTEAVSPVTISVSGWRCSELGSLFTSCCHFPRGPLSCPAPPRCRLSSPSPEPDRILKCDPQVQQPESRNYSPHRPVGRQSTDTRILKEERVLVPEHRRPRRVADGQADIHPEHHPQHQLKAFQPAWHSRCRFRSLRAFAHLYSPIRRRRPWGRARGERSRYRFRLLEHSDSGARRLPIPAEFEPLARTGKSSPPHERRSFTVTQRASAESSNEPSSLLPLLGDPIPF